MDTKKGATMRPKTLTLPEGMARLRALHDLASTLEETSQAAYKAAHVAADTFERDALLGLADRIGHELEAVLLAVDPSSKAGPA